MRCRATKTCLSLAAAAAISACWPAMARAESPPSAIIVFDGSGSIWGELGLEKRSKFDIAREILRASLAKAGKDNRIGLMAFGHRRKGDCSDVEMVVPPDAGAPERIALSMDKLNPKGKGPIVLAMREAHKALAASTGPASVVILHDGPDNCGQDPCLAATELAKANPRIRIHLVGLGLERADAQKLSCVPRLTGGKMFEANDAATAGAAIAEAFKLANLIERAPEAPAQATAPEAPPAPTDTDGPPRVRITASLMEGGGAIAAPLRWRIFKDGALDVPVVERTAAEIFEPLPAGKYIVEAHSGLVLTRGPVEVAGEGLTAVRVPLNAGWIKIAAKAARTGEPLSDALATVSRKEAGEGGEALATEPIWIGRSEAEIFVPAGTYAVRLDSGLVSSEQSITLTGGGRALAEFTPALGTLELSAAMVEGGPVASDASFVVAEDDPDAPQGRREITRSAHPEPKLSLPAGTYYVTARLGDAEVRQRIAVGPGDTVKRTLVLGMARLEVTAAMEAGPLPAGAGLLHRVLTLDGEPREVARSTATPATFALASGRYRVETMLGSENVRAATDVDLQPGLEAKVAQRLQAGRVTIKPAESSGSAAAGHVTWELRDDRGQVVWRAGQVESKTALLAPGHYVIRSDAADRTAEKAFDLKAGEQRTVDPAGP